MVKVEKSEKQIDFVYSAAVRLETLWAVLFGYLAMLRNNCRFKWWYFSEINCYFHENLIHFLFWREHFFVVFENYANLYSSHV